MVLEYNSIRHYANNLHLTSASYPLFKALVAKKKCIDALANLFAGHEYNHSDKLPVLFPSIRSQASLDSLCDKATPTEGHLSSAKMLHLATQIFEGSYRLASKKPIKYIIHLGAGGSALGPQLLAHAFAGIRPAQTKAVLTFFISNVDGHQLSHALAKCTPDQTLVIVNSKSFTTNETLQNLAVITKWKRGKKNKGIPHQDIIAITAYPERTAPHGIQESSLLTYPQWLGGRYSLFSTVSFILPALFGSASYQALLIWGKGPRRHH